MFLLTLICHLSLRGIVFLFQSALEKLHYPVRSFVNVDYSSLVDTINMESSVILLISIIYLSKFSIHNNNNNNNNYYYYIKILF